MGRSGGGNDKMLKMHEQKLKCFSKQTPVVPAFGCLLLLVSCGRDRVQMKGQLIIIVVRAET